jgi:Ca2+-binding EF-hand superfamily protein
MRSAVVVAALLASAAICIAHAQSPGPLPVVTLPAPGESIRVELDILVDELPPAAAWNQFLDRLFDFFDRDRDGSLSPLECGRLVALPLPDQKQLHFDFSSLDGDGNGRADRSELKTYCSAGGYPPVVIRVERPSADDLRLSGVFRQWLDDDHDGIVSVTELRRAARTMSRYDLDENGAVAVKELLNSTAEPVGPVTPPSSETRAANERGTRVRVRLDAPKSPAEVSEEAANLLTAVGGASANIVRYRGPQNAWTLAIETQRKLPNVKSASDFLTAQLQTVLGNRTELTLQEIKQDPGLSGLAELAPIADRNGDERLSLAELQSYSDLVAAALRSQIWVTLADRNCNLFSLLDGDADGNLRFIEMAQAEKMVGMEADSTSLPQQFHISFAAAPIRTWGGMMIPAPAKRLPSATKEQKSWLPWFQALDRNEDGIVSPREFLGPPEVFRMLDGDGDGMITLSEATSATAR